jgi:autotransporter translocation and assembly factor TamB
MTFKKTTMRNIVIYWLAKMLAVLLLGVLWLLFWVDWEENHQDEALWSTLLSVLEMLFTFLYVIVPEMFGSPTEDEPTVITTTVQHPDGTFEKIREYRRGLDKLNLAQAIDLHASYSRLVAVAELEVNILKNSENVNAEAVAKAETDLEAYKAKVVSYAERINILFTEQHESYG